MNRLSLTYFLCFSLAYISAQLKPEIIWPLDSPRVLTGNYGELRPNHFHAGLDFSTNGNVNLQVYAIEEGYVSRVRISSVGYGKSVYITHMNGKTSVYAHLNAFSLKIDKIVKEEQYAKHSYEVELFPKAFSVFVRKNEIIGLSGNTGGSTGPHLHFELRDEKTEVPLNPLNYYRINDQTPPHIERLAFYTLADSSQPRFLRSIEPAHHSVADTLELSESHLGLAFSGYDQFLPNGNHNNIYAASVFLDGQLIYAHQLKHIDFADNRYVNEFSEQVGGSKYQKCFLPSIYPSGFCSESVNKGRIYLNDTKTHHLKLISSDETGNESEANIYLKTKLITPYAEATNDQPGFVNCNEQNNLVLNHVCFSIPPTTFYYCVNLEVQNHLNPLNHIDIQPAHANLRSALQLGFKVPDHHLAHADKLVLKGPHATYTPVVRNDSVFYLVKSLGGFTIHEDKEAPDAKLFLSKKKYKRLSDLSSLTFGIHDHLSGIGKYNLYVNGQWVIAEYDAKSDALTYFFDEKTPFGELRFQLEVADRVGNALVVNYLLKR